MDLLKRAGATGLSAAMALLTTLHAAPASAASSYDIAIGDASQSEGSTLDFVVSVTWVGQHHPAFSVNYTTVAGLASATDFTATSGTLNIARDATTATISVPTTQDTIFEPDETFTVTLDPASTTANVLDADAVGTIENEDGVPRITINDVTVTEGNDPAAYVDAMFDVQLSNSASQPVTVNYRTADDTALGGNVDYRNANGTLTFPAENNATQQVRVRVKGDTTHEGDERYFVNLFGAVNGTVQDGQGVGTIRDNDGVPLVSVPTAPLASLEGDRQHVVNVTATLTNATIDDVVLRFSTQNGTALAGSDYTDARSVQVTIPAGSLSAQLPVTILGDTRFELSENLFVILDSADGASLGNQVAELSLTNDDTIIIVGP